MPQTLSKSERLSGKTAISRLMDKGKWGGVSGFRYCFLASDDAMEQTGGRIMISVPKRLFKRAVKRNLLKRRIREAYRTQKELLGGKNVDILFQYNSAEVMDYATICEAVKSILDHIN